MRSQVRYICAHTVMGRSPPPSFKSSATLLNKSCTGRMTIASLRRKSTPTPASPHPAMPSTPSSSRNPLLALYPPWPSNPSQVLRSWCFCRRRTGRARGLAHLPLHLFATCLPKLSASLQLLPKGLGGPASEA